MFQKINHPNQCLQKLAVANFCNIGYYGRKALAVKIILKIMQTKKENMIKTILEAFVVAGEIMIYAMEPRVNMSLRRELSRYGKYKNEQTKDKKGKKFYNAFYSLKRNEMIDIEYRGNQMYFSLTEEGKKKAGKYKIDDLVIKKPKKWDKRWRVLIFDIEDRHKSKREALRGKIKELGLYQLQKSVWVCPYEFKSEMRVLRDFFGLDVNEMKVINASDIEDDKSIRTFFGLK